MYSFSSASQMCEPFPRTINGGSPPTEANARTGEFTPPGIMLSARCCKRRDCSTFRDVVDGIVAPTRRMSKDEDRATTIAALPQTNSSDIHDSAIILQHRAGNVGSSRCPSNREGSKDSFGGSGCPYFLSLGPARFTSNRREPGRSSLRPTLRATPFRGGKSRACVKTEYRLPDKDAYADAV